MSGMICNKTLVLHVIFIMLCITLLFRAVVWMQQNIPEYKTMTTKEMVDGTGKRPFMYRVLVPKTLSIAEKALPESVFEKFASWGRQIAQTYNSIVWIRIAVLDEQDDRFFALRFMAGIIGIMLLVGYGIAMYRLGAYFDPEGPGRYLSVLLAYYLIPISSWGASFIYDPATLFFAASCFYFIVTQKWALYMGCFLLACLNKETSIFIFLLFVVCNYDRLDKRIFLRLCLWQILIWFFVTLCIRLLYIENQGYMFAAHWYEYLVDLRKHMPFHESLSVLAVLFLLFFGWEDKPLLLKRSVWVAAAVIIIWMYGGRMQELRGIYDALPVFILLLTHSFTFAMNYKPRSH